MANLKVLSTGMLCPSLKTIHQGMNILWPVLKFSDGNGNGTGNGNGNGNYDMTVT